MPPADRQALHLIGAPVTIGARLGRPTSIVVVRPRPDARQDLAGRRMDRTTWPPTGLIR